MTIFSFFSRLINSAIAGLNEGKKLSGETAFSQIQVLVSLLLAKNLAGLSRQFASKHFQPFLNGRISMTVITNQGLISRRSRLPVHVNVAERNA